MKTLCLVSLAVLLLATGASAQQGSSELRGVVIDEQNAVLPGATLTIRNQDTGTFRETVSNADGAYFVTGLVPGVYEVRASLPGFREHVRPDVRLEVGRTITVDLMLEVGRLEEAVTVTSETPLLDLTSKEIGGHITCRDDPALSIQRQAVRADDDGRHPAAAGLLAGGQDVGRADDVLGEVDVIAAATTAPRSPYVSRILRCPLLRRPGAHARRVQSQTEEQIARGDVQPSAIRVAEADIGRAHLLPGLAGHIGKLNRAEPFAGGRGDADFARPGAGRGVEIAGTVGFHPVVALHVRELAAIGHTVVGLNVVAHDFPAERHVEVSLVG